MDAHSARLIDLGQGLFAYLQGDGGWGWSNAGLIVDGDQSLLIDTLFDEPLTQTMLDRMRDATGLKAADIDVVVNTHANGDHTHGNALLDNAAIIASEASAREMAEFTPQTLAMLKQQGVTGAMGEAGLFFADIFGPFDFANARGKAPTQTFCGHMDLMVGDKEVHLIEVGPAHTAGDALVHVPKDRTVFTGDILFIESTPIMWAGPVENWINACDRILAMDVDVIVPGHGPLATKAQAKAMQGYLRYIDAEARKRFEAGLSAEEATRDIALGDYASWGDAERIAVNVETLYRFYRYGHTPPNVLLLFERMAQVRKARR
jgi:glyoxylase-like metal-dependent hydrolase (beta-lactamase superfamily II)